MQSLGESWRAMGHGQCAPLFSQWPGFTANLHVPYSILKLHVGNASPPFEECIRHRERAKWVGGEVQGEERNRVVSHSPWCSQCHLSLSAFLLWCLTLHEFNRCRLQPMLLSLIQRHFYFVAGKRWESEVKKKKKNDYLKCIDNKETERRYFHTHNGKSAVEAFIALFCWLPHSQPLSCNR